MQSNESAAGEYFDKLGAHYIDPADRYAATYHDNRMATTVALIQRSGVPKGASIFDFGCGDGVLFDRLADYSLAGCDASQVMVDMARQRCPAAKIEVGGVDYFCGLKRRFDIVVALNVLPYLTVEQENRFFEQARQITDFVVVSYANQLFDLVTFNRYTVEFFEHHFSGLVAPEAMAMLPALMKNAQHPPREDRHASERDRLVKRRANPLTVKADGFAEVETRYLNFFPLPPAILQSREDWRQRQVETKIDDGLAPLFASQFQRLYRRM